MIGLVKQVAHFTGISVDSCRRIAKSSHRRYKRFAIPKKNGGIRFVAQPAREVKAVQRAIADILGQVLPVHAAATAYQQESSIIKNAAAHRQARYLSKFDFSNFFPSIDAAAISLLLANIQNISESEIQFVVDACTWRPEGRAVLCLGAPSSPFLSNAVMFGFDESVVAFCTALDVSYTRYSDDMTISSAIPNVLSQAEVFLRDKVARMRSPVLRLNEEKRVAVSRKTALRVTGLTLSNDGRVTVGRCRKRGVRAGVHRYAQGQMQESELVKLKGELAFVLDVEPNFARVLVLTYGPRIAPLLPGRLRAIAYDGGTAG